MILTRRALNRATLARQLLLERHVMSASDAVTHLVGIQAQNPHDPYFALWSRLEGFDHDELTSMVADRHAVRAQLMRATIHLMTAADFVAVRPVMQSVCERVLGSTMFAKDTAAVDRDELLAAGRRLIDEEPRTRAQLAALLSDQWPEVPASSLAQVVTYVLPVVQVPPRGLWGRSGPAAWTTAERWLGRSPAGEGSVDALVVRYLAAFGPATTSDVRTWSGLTGLTEVMGRLRPKIVTFRDEGGRELFDLPEAPRPDAETPAPPRFLPEYDNLLLGHADRSRFIDPGRTSPGWVGNLMVDGMLAGTWKLATDALEVSPFSPLPKRHKAAVADEAESLLRFVDPGGRRRVAIVSP